MSLRPQPVPPVPEETARVAHAAFPDPNIYMLLRDEIGVIAADEDFAPLFPTHGQPAEAPWRLALATVFQFIEGLSDRAAADAVRSRIDWKYALSLELTDPGFDSSVLCEFRARLVAGGAEHLLFDKLLDLCRGRKWLRARGRQRTDSTHVLARVRAVNRLECVGETMRHALNTLAAVAPGWLREQSRAEWVGRYGRRADDYHLPTGKEARHAYAEVIGTDGDTLLSAIYDRRAPLWLREVPAVETLRRVWVQQYHLQDGLIRWRTEEEGIPPSSLFISSPYDVGARYAKKHTTSWVGYKVHLTETCEDGEPHLITDVKTTAGPVADGEATPLIHQALERKGLLPGKHIVDTGYLDAELLVRSKRDHEVELLGPTRPDYKWQARAAEGFDASSFRIDWERERATCPAGHTSLSWSPAVDKRANEFVKIKFSMKDCQPCANRAQCTRAKRRTITVRRRDEYCALQVARERERTDEYATEYRKRAGVEGTLSQGVRSCGLRRSRYIGLAKTHLQHVLTAAAINCVRVYHWLAGRPLAKTQISAFGKLMGRPAPC